MSRKMSKCNSCDRNIPFMDVLKTPNPIKLRCGGCKEAISLEAKSAVLAGVILSLLALAVMFYFKEIQPVDNFWIYVVLPAVLFIEVAYFSLIKSGMIKVKA